jgi:hypothetical protein
VIVNPGAICIDVSSKEITQFPCFLFFDSLGLHKRVTIAKKLRGWLNSEWSRKRKGEPDPFTVDSMKLYTPQGMYSSLQDVSLCAVV